MFPRYISENGIVYNGYFVFLGFAASSAIVGSVISEKMHRRKFLISWIIIGLISNSALFFIGSLGSAGFLVLSAFLGISIGLGFPSCLSYLADCTAVEERSRIAGLSVLLTLLIAIGSFVVADTLNFGVGLIALLFVIRASSLSTFVLDTCERQKDEKTQTWVQVFTTKNFLLYLIPWLLFSFTGSFIDPIISPVVTTMGLALHYVFWAIFAFLSGVMADRLGRKQPIVLGLMMLGISFAILSVTITSGTVFIYNVLSGVAWGFLFTVYITVLGDLGQFGSKEKFYAMGAIMPLILTLGFGALTNMFGVIISEQILALLTIILFLSILPVLRATETLPEKKMHSRKIKEHIDKVGKLVKDSKKQK
jgi:MFS family permease